jgi:hypothetical protein
VHRLGLLALASLVLAAAIYNLVVLTKDRGAAATLQATDLQVSAARSTLSKLASAIVSVDGTRDARQQTRARTLSEIATAQRALQSASATNGLQSLDIAALKTCLAGVSNAMNALQSSNLPGAINAIDAASPTCQSLDGSTDGPVYPFNFPDPSVLTVGDQYYAFATNSAAGNVQVIQSADLNHWVTLGDALPHLAIWAQPNNIWAPSAVRIGTSYALYYSADFAATQEECISVAIATQPQGPYVDSTTWPIECQLDLGGSLDPSAFVDANGTPYLTWKSGTGTQPSTLWSQQLKPDGTGLVPGPPASLLTPTQPWQGGIVEGPNMLVSGGQYRLLYSANSWRTSAYAIGVADCTGPSGPCADVGQPLLTSQSRFSGPGGPATFTDTKGSLWLAFHGWQPGAIGYPHSRLLFLRPVTLTATGAAIGP